jgi:hypothetical protein
VVVTNRSHWQPPSKTSVHACVQGWVPGGGGDKQQPPSKTSERAHVRGWVPGGGGDKQQPPSKTSERARVRGWWKVVVVVRGRQTTTTLENKRTCLSSTVVEGGGGAVTIVVLVGSGSSSSNCRLRPCPHWRWQQQLLLSSALLAATAAAVVVVGVLVRSLAASCSCCRRWRRYSAVFASTCVQLLFPLLSILPCVHIETSPGISKRKTRRITGAPLHLLSSCVRVVVHGERDGRGVVEVREDDVAIFGLHIALINLI